MIVKDITYTDYKGNSKTKKCFFNLTSIEIAEMETSEEGSLTGMINKITETGDPSTIVKFFKTVILKSYGEVSEDGERFVKVDSNGIPLSVAFSQTDAYSKLFVEMVSDPNVFVQFINNLIPTDLVDNLDKIPNLTAVTGN